MAPLVELLRNALWLACGNASDEARLVGAIAKRLLQPEKYPLGPRPGRFRESLATLGAAINKEHGELRTRVGGKMKQFLMSPHCANILIYHPDAGAGSVELDIYGMLVQVKRFCLLVHAIGDCRSSDKPCACAPDNTRVT